MIARVVKPTTRKRRWFRFRLRTLLGLVTVLAVLMGWVATQRNQSHHERQVAKQLEKQGVDVTLGGPYDSRELRLNQQPQGWWRRLARQILGERILRTSLIEQSNFKDLTPLAGLKTLQALRLRGTPVSDEQVKSLQQALPNCQITR